jgi:hypothetical protein
MSRTSSLPKKQTTADRSSVASLIIIRKLAGKVLEKLENSVRLAKKNTANGLAAAIESI